MRKSEESSLAIWYLRNDNKRQSSTFFKNGSDNTYMQKICVPAQPVHHIAYITGQSSYVLCKRSGPSCPPPMPVSASISQTTNNKPMKSQIDTRGIKKMFRWTHSCSSNKKRNQFRNNIRNILKKIPTVKVNEY